MRAGVIISLIRGSRSFKFLAVVRSRTLPGLFFDPPVLNIAQIRPRIKELLDSQVLAAVGANLGVDLVGLTAKKAGSGRRRNGDLPRGARLPLIPTSEYGAAEESHPGRGHRHPDLWRLPINSFPSSRGKGDVFSLPIGGKFPSPPEILFSLDLPRGGCYFQNQT
jgi:hypothetical protein